MRAVIQYISGLLLGLLTCLPTAAQNLTAPDSVLEACAKKHPWIAAAEVTAINLAIMTYDQIYLKDEQPCYNVTGKSIEKNLKMNNWSWDNDYFHTNAINHPYHGSLYYTAARSNNMTIAESSAFTLLGCLEWEIFCEAEPPAINDLITTTVGGIALGEPMHIVSSRILDDSKRGLERVGREVLAMVIDPMLGLNRLVRGESWRVRHQTGKDREAGHTMRAGVELGIRHIDIHEKTAITIPYFRADIDYGDAMGSEGRGLFDYFTLNLTLAGGKRQPVINCVEMKNQLWSRQLIDKEQSKMAVGLYNHFDYFNTHPQFNMPANWKNSRPYGYLEIGSIGPGIIYRSGNHIRWEQQLFINGIALGATPDDSKHQDPTPDRRYSFGSGYGGRFSSSLQAGNWLRLQVDGKFSQLFCWDGFMVDDPNQREDFLKQYVRNNHVIPGANISIQGEAGNAVTMIAESHLELTPLSHLGLGVHGRYFWHHSNYKFHPHATSHSWELHAGLRYSF
ncbi:MAG: DUF3943 domain-containing protein [Prevotella sp.]|nr:DUF3943 domain-containing protein [Prevotella sp.]